MKLIKYWLPVALWAAVIYTFSSMNAVQASEIYWQEFLVKKTAHIVEYFIFYVLSFRAFVNGTGFDKRASFTAALLLTIFYAMTDEFHQSFTPGREPSLRDVLIDTGAGVIAWMGIWKLLPKAPRQLRNLASSLQIS